MIPGIKFRYLQPEDEPFIYATWLKGLYFGNAWFRKISQDAYFNKYREVVKHLLSSATTVLAVLEEDPDVIVGYCVSAPNVEGNGSTVHWVYVKQAWRAKGIARAIIPINMTRITHLTDNVTKPAGVKFDPLLTE
jgi:GNAT superfamily N-acetyltransferase